MPTIKAVIGIIFNANKVLLTQRQNHQFMAGFWEFAGGKIKDLEKPIDALKREMREELAIEVKATKYLKKISYKYSKKTVNLEVFMITEYSGDIIGVEGQNIKWVDIYEVKKYQILPTVLPLLNNIILPKIYWITPDQHYCNEWMLKFEQQIKNKVRLIQLRSKEDLDIDFVKNIYQKCQKNNIKLLLNIPNFSNDCDGYHLTSKQLMQTQSIDNTKIIAASTHNLEQIQFAEKLGIDFVVLSPIKITSSHSDITPIGFDKAGYFVKNVNIPVYFLGGMNSCDLELAKKHYAQGVAGITMI